MAHANFALLAVALGFASSSAEPMSDSEFSSAIASIIVRNGLACAEVLDVRPLQSHDQFEVLCSEREGESATARYIMNVRNGTAVKA